MEDPGDNFKLSFNAEAHLPWGWGWGWVADRGSDHRCVLTLVGKQRRRDNLLQRCLDFGLDPVPRSLFLYYSIKELLVGRKGNYCPRDGFWLSCLRVLALQPLWA